jgi:DNA-binding transcriptional LysR family regulator
MDRLGAMHLFTRIVERKSFTLAANDTGVPRSTVTTVIRELEARLGVRLLQRTTRTVSTTLDGEAYYRRCLAILADVDDAEGAFKGVRPKGLVRVDAQGTLARHFLVPKLPEFFERYPDIELSMSESDRWVDIVPEGVDCVLRYGHLGDSDLVARRVAELERMTCASPAYLERFGRPESFRELAAQGHRVVGLRSITTGLITPMDFGIDDGRYETVHLPATLSVTGTESYLAGLRLGVGIAQVPRFHVEEDLASGRLVQILEATPPPSMPVSLVYPRSRQLSPRVRVFLDWAAQAFAAAQQGTQKR